MVVPFEGRSRSKLGAGSAQVMPERVASAYELRNQRDSRKPKSAP